MYEYFFMHSTKYNLHHTFTHTKIWVWVLDIGMMPHTPYPIHQSPYANPHPQYPIPNFLGIIPILKKNWSWLIAYEYGYGYETPKKCVLGIRYWVLGIPYPLPNTHNFWVSNSILGLAIWYEYDTRSQIFLRVNV